MRDLLYFAYGSNMLRQRLDARCPHVQPAGVATLADYRLMFDQYSAVDDSGKGGIQAAPGRVVHGVLWSLPLRDLPALDRAEDRGASYRRVRLTVTHADGRLLAVTTYLPMRIHEGLLPWDWYLHLVIAGAQQHRLPESYVSWLTRVPYKVDPESDRGARRVAMAALQRAELAA